MKISTPRALALSSGSAHRRRLRCATTRAIARTTRVGRAEGGRLARRKDTQCCFKDLDYKFLIFIDDITLDNSQNEFKLFKSILDGSLISDSQNVKFYVTSNLRHLSNKDPIEENIDEITKKENYSNIVSLSDRFGIRLGFFENNKENYLKIVQHYANINGISLKKEEIEKASEWSLEKGNFSGRTAYQFILSLKKN
mgnify:CR=1 FL=1